MNRRNSRDRDDDYDYEEYDEREVGQAEDGDEPLRLVDQLLTMAADRDPARPLLYQLRRQLMEREKIGRAHV